MTNPNSEDWSADSGLPVIPSANDGFLDTGPLGIADVEIDSQFIAAVAAAGLPEGESTVEQHHRILWMAANARALGQAKCHRSRCLKRIEMMQGFFQETADSLRRVAAIVQQPEWSRWDWVKFWFSICGLVVLVGASVSTVFTLLRNTAVFEQMPVAAFITAGLVAAIPVAGKLGIDGIRSETVLARLRLLLGWAAVVIFCVWAILLARLTGGLGGGLQDPLVLVSSAGAESSLYGWPLSVHLQYLQLILELLGSLACFTYADLLQQRSRAGRPAISSMYLLMFRRFVQAERALDSDQFHLGDGKGLVRQLKAQRQAFVGRARAEFLAVLQLKERRDQLRGEYARVQSALDSAENEFRRPHTSARLQRNGSK